MNDSRSMVRADRRPSVSAPSLPTRVGDTPLRVKWRSRRDRRRAGNADAAVALAVRASRSAWNQVASYGQALLSCAGTLDIELAHVGAESSPDNIMSGVPVAIVGTRQVAVVNLAETGETWEDEDRVSRALVRALATSFFTQIRAIAKRTKRIRIQVASGSRSFASDLKTALSVQHSMLRQQPETVDLAKLGRDLASMWGVEE